MLEIKDENFNNEIAEGIAVVDFWAPWCGPCKMLGPVLEDVAAELGEVKFCKLNVDENIQIPQQFSVASIPTVMVFKNGNLVDKAVGFRPKEELIQLVKKHI